MADIDTITQEDFDVAEESTIAAIREQYPDLDLRVGTVLREHLIRPAAWLQALTDARIRYRLENATLSALALQDAPDPDIMDSLLSNFGLTYSRGSNATGTVKIVFEPGTMATVRAGTVLTSAGNLTFTVDSTVNVTGTEVDAGDGVRRVTYALVTATGVGGEYNVPAGTSFSAGEALPGTEILAHTGFYGGANAETGQQAVDRILPALSHRSLSSSVSCTALLRDRFDTMIRDVKLQGVSSPAMIRDDGVLSGFGTGGMVDAYVRTFTSPRIIILEKKGTKNDDGTATITLSREECDGLYAIRSVIDWDQSLAGTDTDTSARSYRFRDARKLVPGSIHAFEVPESWHYTSFQTCELTVYDIRVPPVTLPGEIIESPGDPEDVETTLFRVECYAYPEIRNIQEYCDGDDVRNEAVDFVVRTPVCCFVAASMTATIPAGSPATADTLRTAISNYINNLGFVEALSASEIVNTAMAAGASTVPLSSVRMTGRVRLLSGEMRRVSGQELDVTQLGNPLDLIRKGTVVFVCDPTDISVTVRSI